MQKLNTSRRVIFVNRFFYPDESATSQILSDLCPFLVEAGFEVTVITSRLSYAENDVRHPRHQDWNGVAIHRVATTGFGRAGILGRLIDYLSFYLTSFFCALRQTRRGDILVAKTDPPLISVPMGWVSRLKGAKFVNWLQDMFPEVAVELGVKPPLRSLLVWLRDGSLKRAGVNVAIGEIMKQRIVARGVAAEQVEIIHNFADDQALQPCAKGVDTLRKAWGFADDDFVLGYSGNLGRAHDFETMLNAAEVLRDEAKIKFLFVGGGHLRKQIETQARQRNLQNLIFKPYQPREELAQSLGVPDMHWVALKSELEGLIVPSKLYGITAVGRPILMIGDVNGEIGRIISSHAIGKTVEIGDVDSAVEVIRHFATTPDAVRNASHKALTYTQNVSSRRLVFRKWIELLQSL